MRKRTGVTLVEVVVAIAIVAILLALLVAVVVRVRESAVCLESKNKLKQIILATHGFANVNNSHLPTVGADSNNANPNQPLFLAVLPFLDGGAFLQVQNSDYYPPLALLISPADPTAAAGIAAQEPICSYAANAQVFQNNPILPGTIRDGVSNTIAFAEHYAYQCGGPSTTNNMTFYYYEWMGGLNTFCRPAFADWSIYPITSGNPPVTLASEPTYTFQVAPSQSNCWGDLAQTPHPSGMLVAMADGSVRQLSPSVAATTYWALVTPAAGDNPGSDW